MIPLELTWPQWAEVVGSLRGDGTGQTAVIADLLEQQVFAMYADYPQRFISEAPA
jgi:hypothetical protein